MQQFTCQSCNAGLKNCKGNAVVAGAFADCMRLHGVGIAEIAILFGLAVGIASVVGTLLNAAIADRLALRDCRVYAWPPAARVLRAFAPWVAAMLSDNPCLSIASPIVPSLPNRPWLGPAFGTVSNLAAMRMRARASAMLLFILAIIGLDLCPFLIGVPSNLPSGHSPATHCAMRS